MCQLTCSDLKSVVVNLFWRTKILSYILREDFFMGKKEIIEAILSDDFTYYYQKADKIRREYKRDVVHIRAIIEFSSYCNMKCQYCGLNVGNSKATRYRMEIGEIAKVAKKAIDAGYRTIVLQGGEDATFADGMKLRKVIESIKNYDENIAVTLSAGELRPDILKMLKEAGANRYLLRHETTDRELYRKLHPGKTFEERKQTLLTLKDLGYETGSGFMVGIPGQSIESLADDLLFLKEISCDMAGMGPYISHPHTPLASNKNGSTELTKRCVAIARILLPECNLPVTTAVGVLDLDERKRAFGCGANVIMRKVNPAKYKKAYEIYPADLGETDVYKERCELEEMISSLGRIPV